MKNYEDKSGPMEPTPIVSFSSGQMIAADEKDNKVDKNISQWSDVDGKFIAVSNTISTLEAGYYSIGFNPSMGMYFQKNDVHSNKLYRLPNKATDIILNDIEKFWKMEDTYKKYNRVFRRNYLLYSAPGTGKTSLINLMCKDLIEKYNGIVIYLNTAEELGMYSDAIRMLRKIEPDRKIIVVIEDIDNFVGNAPRNGLDSYILNILDGNLKTNGVVIIATTNYIETLDGRYKNRPSRFNRVIEFPLPNAESRKVFIEHSILPEDLEKVDLDKWVRETEGFTIDHINELIQLVLVFGEDEDSSFDIMKKMVDENNHLKNETSLKNGKSIGFSDTEW